MNLDDKIKQALQMDTKEVKRVLSKEMLPGILFF